MDSILPPVLLPMTGLADPTIVANGTQDVETAAQGFEEMFASLIIKELRGTLEPDSLFGQDKGDVLGGLFDHYMGQHLAHANALGIGALVRQQLTRARGNHAQPAGHGQHAPATVPGPGRARNAISVRA